LPDTEGERDVADGGRPISAGTLAYIRSRLGLPVSATNAEVLAAIESVTKQPPKATPPKPASSSTPPIGEVVQLCRQLGVGTAEVRASGRTITLENIRATAAEKRSATAAGPGPKSRRRAIAAAPAHDPRHLRIAAASAPAGAEAHYQLNPFVEQSRAKDPHAYTDAVEANPNMPSLFASGPLPPFCASGIDPEALLAAPWYARHRIAAATSKERAGELLAAYAGEDGVAAALLECADDPGNQEYGSRVRDWLTNGSAVAAARETEAEAEQRYEVRAAGPFWLVDTHVADVTGDQV